MNANNAEKYRSPLITFGLIILLVGFFISFLAGIAMDPYKNTPNELTSALGRVVTGIGFQLVGLALILIGKK